MNICVDESHEKHKRKIIGYLTEPVWNESYIPIKINELRYRTGYYRVTLIRGLKEKKLLA